MTGLKGSHLRLSHGVYLSVKGNSTRQKEKLCAYICMCMQNALEWQKVCDGGSETNILKMCVSPK